MKQSAPATDRHIKLLGDHAKQYNKLIGTAVVPIRADLPADIERNEYIIAVEHLTQDQRVALAMKLSADNHWKFADTLNYIKTWGIAISRSEVLLLKDTQPQPVAVKLL